MTPLKIIKVGRSKVKVYHSNFEYFQPNVHISGDCAVRAVAKALDKTWYDVYDKLCEVGRKMQLMPSEREVVGKYLESEGFVWVPISVRDGSKRPKVADFAAEHKNASAVMSLANHYTSSKNGKYYDIWDCGFSAVYGYWIKKS